MKRAAYVTIWSWSCRARRASVWAPLASARGSVVVLLDDASDGVVDGSYSAAQVRAALTVVRSDPAYMQYSDIEGVLVDYLASITQIPRPSPTPTRPPYPDPDADARASDARQKATPDSQSNASRRQEAGEVWRREGEATPGSKFGAPATTRPLPSVTGLGTGEGKAGGRAGFFAVGAVALIGGVVLARRRRVRPDDRPGKRLVHTTPRAAGDVLVKQMAR